MSETIIAFAATKMIPVGLMLIMFSLGLTLALGDFVRLFERPRAALTGLGGQIILLPIIGWNLAILFELPPALALSLVILSACPGGVTSNAVVFAARGDVALSVTLTATSSLITIVTTPLLVSLGIDFFYTGTTAPTIDSLEILSKLIQLTVLPLSLGMLLRNYQPSLAARFVRYLRPTSIAILFLVIGVSVFASFDLIVQNIVVAGPVVFLMNGVSMVVGYYLGALMSLGIEERMTLGIEVGIQNATTATFLSLAILNMWEFAVIPTLYGIIMLANAGLFIWILRNLRKAH